MKYLKNSKGFTLIEIMTALLIAVTIITSVYYVLLSDFIAFQSHNQILDTHQEEKMALEFMSREIQFIGYDAETSPVTADIIKAKEDTIQFEEYNTLNSTRAKILYEDDHTIKIETLFSSF